MIEPLLETSEIVEPTEEEIKEKEVKETFDNNSLDVGDWEEFENGL